jgi:hypothetical protein
MMDVVEYYCSNLKFTLQINKFRKKLNRPYCWVILRKMVLSSSQGAIIGALLMSIVWLVPSAATPVTSIIEAAFATDVEGDNCAGVLLTIRDTAGDDSIVGTPGDDVIAGFEGNDRIQGLGGNDIICGGGGKNGAGDGNDFIEGGDGNDHLFGELGNDDIRGAPVMTNLLATVRSLPAEVMMS